MCVLRRLYYTDTEGKRLALSGLRRTGDKTALPCYLEAIASADQSLRVQGIRGLGEIRDPTLLPTLRQLLKKEKDPLVGIMIAQALAASEDKEGLAYLEGRLADKQEQVRDSVVGLLSALEETHALPLLRVAFQSDPSATVRTTAAASLAHFKDPRGLPLLQEALEDIDFRIRLGAAIALDRMDYTTAKPLIVRAMRSEDPFVRTNALKVVGENIDYSVLPLVVETMGQERDRYVKSQALWALGKIGDRKTVPVVMDLLTEEREEVRHSAAEALVMLSDRLLEGAGSAERKLDKEGR